MPVHHEDQVRVDPRVERARTVHMRPKLLRLAGLVVVTALAGLAAGAASAAASPVVVHVYVNDNAVVNTVAGFDRHADGSLSPISGSPFAAGGAGTGTTLPSQGALQMSDDGKYLLAVDAGSNESFGVVTSSRQPDRRTD